MGLCYEVQVQRSRSQTDGKACWRVQSQPSCVLGVVDSHGGAGVGLPKRRSRTKVHKQTGHDALLKSFLNANSTLNVARQWAQDRRPGMTSRDGMKYEVNFLGTVKVMAAPEVCCEGLAANPFLAQGTLKSVSSRSGQAVVEGLHGLD